MAGVAAAGGVAGKGTGGALLSVTRPPIAINPTLSSSVRTALLAVQEVRI